MFYLLYLWQDLLYNKTLRRGFLHDKLKNVSKKQGGNIDDIVNDGETHPGASPEIDEIVLLEFLKTCVVKNDLPDIKKKLTESVSIRRKFLQKPMAEIQEMFPFYFADPRLVSIYSCLNLDVERLRIKKRGEREGVCEKEREILMYVTCNSFAYFRFYLISISCILKLILPLFSVIHGIILRVEFIYFLKMVLMAQNTHYKTNIFWISYTYSSFSQTVRS